ncbi:hypothetical protein A5819_003661 [Enterococcus sp. 7E2_DIV0204]|uniref:winged helix-turn-helix domain-containing protein n=1 Tax=unclassified Enterococcus TaxID=2608891 RepID=UPI000A35B84C|nr:MULTISPECIES: helix-turn-helix domain-containing protein [unclassified Enterococcus]OTN83842.1 hypothetical protein A5819_003661 [Enterococcus sp. 7E2_DIV0204]OTP47517.1 hypothetical protein A5884_003488 [Enterococcus sp. 7D2_DIV0200]
MKNTIGLLSIGDNSDKIDNIGQLLRKKLDQEDNSILEISSKSQLNSLDGLVISIDESSDYIIAIQWLVELKEDHPLFVWILSGENHDKLEVLLPSLSKNSVIDIIDSEQVIEVLLAKIKSFLNYKSCLLQSKEEKNISEKSFLDRNKLCLVIDNKIIPLTRKEFQVFELLYQNLGDVVTYEAIHEAMYGERTSLVSEKYRVANLIFHIRNKLKEQFHFEIEIIRTKGYLLTYSNKERFLSAIHVKKTYNEQTLNRR